VFEDVPIKEAIRHEFGYLVIGRHFGFTPVAVELKSEKEARAVIDFTHSETIDFLRGRIQNLYAGAYAQIVTKDGNECPLSGGKADMT
jgi:hypothetical protein